MLKTLVVLVLISWRIPCVEASSCGTTGKQCVAGQATCRAGNCECNKPPYSKGDGFFACYTVNQTYAELKNDPILNTFNNEKTPFPYPCRFLFTHVRLQLRDRSDATIGTCEAIVHAYNDKVKGKFYTKGFDLALRLSYNNGTDAELSVRNYGIARRGDNFFTVRGTAKDYLPDGPFGFESIDILDAVNGVKVKNYEDRANNRLVFEAFNCGLGIAFIPYDIELLRHQAQVPGLSLAISCDYDPRFLSNDLTVALPSTNCQQGTLLEDIRFPGLSPEESIVARALETYVIQSQPNPNPECLAGHETTRDCDDKTRAKAFRSCYWMLKENTFIECMDDTSNGEVILSVFNDCVSSFCNGVSTCRDVIDYIIQSQCDSVPGIPQLADFLHGRLCW